MLVLVSPLLCFLNLACVLDFRIFTLPLSDLFACFTVTLFRALPASAHLMLAFAFATCNLCDRNILSFQYKSQILLTKKKPKGTKCTPHTVICLICWCLPFQNQYFLKKKKKIWPPACHAHKVKHGNRSLKHHKLYLYNHNNKNTYFGCCLTGSFIKAESGSRGRRAVFVFLVGSLISLQQWGTRQRSFTLLSNLLTVIRTVLHCIDAKLRLLFSCPSHHPSFHCMKNWNFGLHTSIKPKDNS